MLLEALEVWGREGLVEGWGGWEGGADGTGLRLVCHSVVDSSVDFLGGTISSGKSLRLRLLMQGCGWNPG